MFDPRMMKLAEVLIHYSLGVQPGWKLAISTTPLAEDIALAAYEEAIKAGAHAYILCELPATWEIFYKHASDAQLQFISPLAMLMAETFDARLSIDAPANTRQLSGADPTRMAMRSKAWRPLMQTFLGRAARGELRWCTTDYPSHAAAQEADMSLWDYQDFVFNAGKLNEPDPVAAWREEGQRQRRLVQWLDGRDQVKIQGKDVDLSMSIIGRTFIPCDGHENFPDGEIFTGPVEDSVNGWVRFAYPAIYAGKEVVDVELWFENGRVVKEKAAKGEALLTSLLNTDPGARFLGELGIGTNYSIPRFTKNMLFDEKLGGTIHMAVGAGYPESGSKNDSGIHWDMLCDMQDGEITVDGETFYRDGKPLVW